MSVLDEATLKAARHLHQQDPDEARHPENLAPSATSNGAERPRPVDFTSRMRTGGAFILDTPPQPPAVWGHGDEVLWAQGEPLIVVGPSGVGKTTLMGQVVRARLGLDKEVLGWPVEPTTGRVLYLAMDRPSQIARSLARQFTAAERQQLDERLVVWPGPPPLDLGRHPGVLLEMAMAAKADTVIIDSLKDAAVKLSDDEVGGTLNRAIQETLVNGIEVASLHHQRKGQAGAKPKTVEDVYGSTWLAAGAGSIILLWGAAGDLIVELTHLKQPAAEVGLLKIEHIASEGRSVIHHGFDVMAYLKHRTRGATVMDVARAMTEKDSPDDNQRKKAERVLRRLVDQGIAHRSDPSKGGDGGSVAAVYHLVDLGALCPK